MGIPLRGMEVMRCVIYAAAIGICVALNLDWPPW